MSFTYVDTDLLEQMRDRMYQILSRIEECAGTLRQMHSQMMGEDLSLSYYPQWEQAVDGCGTALQKADRLSETADRLLRILEAVPGEYQEMERQHAQAIERLSTRMSSLSSGMAGVMAADYPVGLEEGENASAALELEGQTAAAVQSLELANLMAVTQVLKEEYSYDQVLPGMPADSSEEEEEKKTKRSAGSKNAGESADEDAKKEAEQSL